MAVKGGFLETDRANFEAYGVPKIESKDRYKKL